MGDKKPALPSSFELHAMGQVQNPAKFYKVPSSHLKPNGMLAWLFDKV
jgi:hypothetical protein